MDFAVAKRSNAPQDSYIRAHYNLVKRRWYAKYGKEEHPIAMESLEIAGVKILYSLPQNTEHEPWTKREINTIVDPWEVSKWWAVLREGVAIIGKPNKKEGTYIITRILHDNVRKDEE